MDWSWHKLISHEHLKATLSVVWSVYVVVVSVWILMQRRAPVATMSWLLSMAALPVVGLVVYYFLGPQRFKRQRIKRLRARSRSQVQETVRRIREVQPNPPPKLLQLAKLVQVASGFPISTATRIDFLSGGAAAFDSILEAVAGAHRHVHLEYYIYEPDATGTRLRDLLIERARAGVQVRLLVDALGSKAIGRSFWQPLVVAGGEFAFFHPTRIGRRLRPVINFRTHRKILVVDGRIGYTGGVNITDEEDVRICAEAYHDAHLRLEGPIVNWLQTAFLEDWAYALDKLPQEVPADLDDLLPELPNGSHLMQLMTSGPDNPLEAIHRVHLAAIHTASERVWLTTPYFVPTEAAIYALTGAALRGLDVRLLVPEKSDSIFVTAAARSYFDDLIATGVKIYEYQARMLHSKTMLVDDDLAIVGTANFDNRSFRLNYEVCAVAYGPLLAGNIEAQFLKDLDKARRVDHQRPQRFGPRLGDSVARLCSPLL